MKNFDEFVAVLKKRILEYMPEEYSEAEVRTAIVQKNNEALTGLTLLRQKDVAVAVPTIYLEPLYEAFKEGKAMEEILEKISEIYVENNKEINFNVEDIKDFEKMISKITPRLVGIEGNFDFLKDRPYTTIEDLACIYQINLGECLGYGEATIPITKSIAEMWGINAYGLHKIALGNLPNLEKFSFKGMSEIMIDLYKKKFGEVDKEMLIEMGLIPDSGEMMYVFSNESTLYGASMLLDNEAMKAVVEKIGEDFFIIPSSVHECIFVPRVGDMSEEDLRRMVVEINATQLAPQERLSNSVYVYKNGTLKKAA